MPTMSVHDDGKDADDLAFFLAFLSISGKPFRRADWLAYRQGIWDSRDAGPAGVIAIAGGR